MKGRTVIQRVSETIIWVAVLPLLLFAHAQATMLAPDLNIKGLTLRSAKIVEARCVSVKENPSSPNLVYTFQVTRMLKGKKRTSKLEVWIPGGHLGNHNLCVPGVTNAAPREGDTMLLFLGSSQQGFFPIGYWIGMKKIAKDKDGQEVVETEKGRWLPLTQVRGMVLKTVEEASE